jgi:hypothetical protein
MLVSTSSYAVQLLDIECRRKLVKISVDMRDRDDAAGVVQLFGLIRANPEHMHCTYNVEKERVSTAAHSILHTIMRHGRSGIRRGYEEIASRLVPPGKPFGSVCLPFGDELPILVGTLGIPIPHQAGPDIISADVLNPQVVDILEWPGEVH